MKKNYFTITVLTFCFAFTSLGQVSLPYSDDFSYADGSLVSNSEWSNVSGTAADFLVSSGQAVVQHGTPDQDVKMTFTSVTGDVFVGFDFSVDDLGHPYSGSDNEYFAHIDFKARMDIVPGTNSGDYTVGISSAGGTAEAIWSTDLTFGQSYRAILKFDQVAGKAQLWIDPSVSTDTSISGSDDGAATVTSFDLRQSDSSENETVRVDDLMIGQTFAEVLVFGATASLKENQIKGFALYPNPVNNGYITVKTADNSAKQVVIYSVLGKKVFSETFTGFSKQINVSRITTGIYMMKVIEGTKTVIKKLIIK